MAAAGTALAGQVGGMMGGLGGVMNTMVTRFQNSTTGIASTEQVGVSKVVNVGQTCGRTSARRIPTPSASST